MTYKNKLIKTALRSPERMMHATILTRGGSIVAVGYNHDDIHSEVSAINKLWPNKRAGCKFINIRIRRDGSLGLSAPCTRCMRELREAGIRSGRYTDSEGNWARIRI